jgi:hypothetical protein
MAQDEGRQCSRDPGHSYPEPVRSSEFICGWIAAPELRDGVASFHQDGGATMPDDPTQPHRVPPPPLQDVLRMCQFPADKAELLTVCGEQCAPSAVIALIQKMPDREYADAADVEREISQIP